MTCPNCAFDLSTVTPVVQSLAICPNCLRSIVLTHDGVRLAAGADTVPLSEIALAALKYERKRLRDAKQP